MEFKICCLFCFLDISLHFQDKKLNNMKPGKARFDYQLEKVNALISESKNHANPALWLFLHDLRTPMFMLESLSKMYTQLHNKNFFAELNERFKEIEDVLGAIDYYAEFLRAFYAEEKIPSSVKVYLESKTREKIVILNEILIKGGWNSGKILKKINEGLAVAKWQEQEEEIANIEKFYHKQIRKIHEFIGETTFNFNNVEADVHELRRKLRWLSIYPQALRGAILLHETKGSAAQLKKYLTKETLSSRFNQLPESENINHHLFLEKNHFLALSWIIFELGKLKDTGLKITVLKDAFQEIYFLKDEQAMNESYLVLGEKYPKMETLLKEASVVAKSFFEEKIIDQLVCGVDQVGTMKTKS